MIRPHVDGWKSIAAHIGRGERWCRYMAKRAERPLPVGPIGGIMRMYIDEYEAWELEERAHPSAHGRGALRSKA